ncbi:DEAD/DEAH box helicase [Dyadobacter jiangsuensis]
METTNELEGFLRSIPSSEASDSLTNRGIAWSIMRSDPDTLSTVNFGNTIETDLVEYGFGILRATLSLHEKVGRTDLVRDSFLKVGRTFETVTTNADGNEVTFCFYRIISGCSYHLAGYSAMSFSILSNIDLQNTTSSEKALVYLLLRNLEELQTFTQSYITSVETQDEYLTEQFNARELDRDEILAIILNVSICRALAFFDFCLQTGNRSFLQGSKDILTTTIRSSATSGFVSIWWIARLCFNIIDDLWKNSLHNLLPLNPKIDDGGTYRLLRRKFIASLYLRKASEVELWPSQIEAARRSIDTNDNLVVALPTSAGKTRIAEIATLVALATGGRVLIITPLRALSAQTERSFRQTFGPLGFTVSSLYGASGFSESDENALENNNIVIATPEKLDFAIRNAPSIIDDVSLIILDEGHMIGKTEREIKYEILVQKLLQRADASQRRLVCLSAILPDGENLDDFTSWIRRDTPGTPVKNPWRPTRQRFGIISWENRTARLNFHYKDRVPFISRFLQKSSPLGRQKKEQPADLKGKTIFAAWKFASEGKRVLIFITQANWVEGFGIAAENLVSRGYLGSLLDNQDDVARALEIGTEWLGPSHPAVKALKIGVAIHHGELPNPFLREIELLLAKGKIRVIVASPTLSQGLNVNAAVLLVPYLVRAGEIISGEEFANVAGRAGRAFVDVEGFVVHIVEDNLEQRVSNWRKLVDSARERHLMSGILYVTVEIYNKLEKKSVFDQEDGFEYLANSIDAWLPDGDQDQETFDETIFLLDKLDAIVLGLIEALDSNSEDLEMILDQSLQGSFFSRQLQKYTKEESNLLKKVVTSRAKLIWNKSSEKARRGYFAMGVGLDTGLLIDGVAAELNQLLDDADEATLNSDEDALIENIQKLADIIFNIHPFQIKKKDLPKNWDMIIEQWLRGTEVSVIGPNNMVFIEREVSFKLVWALEAIRMRRSARLRIPIDNNGTAAACLENGVPAYSMALLIKSGLPSRQAAIKAVRLSRATFSTKSEMNGWLKSELVGELSKVKNWPTSNTSQLWRRFRDNALSNDIQIWNASKRLNVEIDYQLKDKLPNGIYRLTIDNDGSAWIATAAYKRLAKLKGKYEEKGKLAKQIRIEDDEEPVLTWNGYGNLKRLR